jgi:hypothetical protein
VRFPHITEQVGSLIFLPLLNDIMLGGGASLREGKEGRKWVEVVGSSLLLKSWTDAIDGAGIVRGGEAGAGRGRREKEERK